MSRVAVGITAGDPCGVGPEIILKALQSRRLDRDVQWLVIGDAPVFRQTAEKLRVNFPARLLVDCRQFHGFSPGRTSAAAGRASLSYLDAALRLWRMRAIQAIVTAPITKWAIQQSRPSFVGHTEYFAASTHSRQVVMVFTAKKLRVAVLTRHIPLRAVSGAVTKPLVISAIRMIVASLKKDFGIAKPRLVICGINPHAGEGSALSEESRVIVPALQALRRAGINCDGPVAADGYFAQPIRHDVVICPYHDQGLIPFKMAARDSGCQVSLGLPFIRTSPDHGSACDIAGKGKADCGSMIAALNTAARLARQRHADSR